MDSVVFCDILEEMRVFAGMAEARNVLMIETILHFFTASEYASSILFLGMFFVGLPVILPALFAGVWGAMNLAMVATFSIVSALLADILWYGVGRYYHTVGQKVIARNKYLTWLIKMFDTHAFTVVFVSRFMYGTKVASSVLAGKCRIGFWKYLNVCFLSMLLWLFLTIGLASILQDLSALTKVTHHLQVAFGLFLAIITLWYVVIGYRLKRNMRGL